MGGTPPFAHVAPLPAQTLERRWEAAPPLPTWHPSLPRRSAASLSPQDPPPPLGAFGPLLLGGEVAYKSEETSPPVVDGQKAEWTVGGEGRGEQARLEPDADIATWPECSPRLRLPRGLPKLARPITRHGVPSQFFCRAQRAPYPRVLVTADWIRAPTRQTWCRIYSPRGLCASPKCAQSVPIRCLGYWGYVGAQGVLDCAAGGGGGGGFRVPSKRLGFRGLTRGSRDPKVCPRSRVFNARSRSP